MDNYQLNFATWNKLAAAYQDKFMDLDLYNDTYDLFCGLVESPKARILEIGCGPGNITRYILSQRPDFQVEGTDIAPNMVQLARKNNPSATFSVLDAREISALTQTYQGIICGFCLPYLSREDVAKLISDCALRLETEGIFYLSAIEGSYDQSGFETSSSGQGRMFVYYHPADFLTAVLQANGFELVHLIRKNYPKPDSTASTHMILITRKK
ncbi:class I SAM-dependent methyltransferase [Rufibacter hautae]|uniref:Class I SAM-dependent methyltransferase n=1 Tax=Rufibacter hautae TaxID=2595005 RepID=A0A5B6TBY3_9BACT|nr:class I SAM-dependent methyltransferase [Rufibacter hautae]KAA3437977.1 class I SAM-dependent methyltransferase [Rufibacter hautae]